MRFYATAASIVLSIVAALFSPLAAMAADTPSAQSIEAILRDQLTKNHLNAIVAEVRENGQVLYKGALGESMSGVPATADMHFRNGALAFTYMSTLLLKFVDEKKTTLDTKLSTYLPELPSADKISLRNLSQMTSGYPDYVYQSEFDDALYQNPFRQWTPQELIHIGVSKPLQFAPGTNWGYSHTNYVILGQVLSKIAGVPLDVAIRQNVLEPMGLTQTTALPTPEIPAPALHSFSSERRSALGVKSGVPFYEEATFWNPSWTTAEGAIETTDISDLCTSIEAVSTGKLLSPASRTAMVVPSLVNFGRPQPNCPACRTMTAALNYGLGMVLNGPWISQSLGFAGASGTVSYLPARKLSVAIEVTNGPAAYDAEGGAPLASPKVFQAVADNLAPGTYPPPPPAP